MKGITDVQIPRDLRDVDLFELLKLPPPHDGFLEDLAPKEIRNLAKQMLSLWTGLTLDLERYQKIKIEGRSPAWIWTRLLLIAGSYYDFLLSSLLREPGRSREFPPGLTLANLDTIINKAETLVLRKRIPQFRRDACFMLIAYLQFRVSSGCVVFRV